MVVDFDSPVDILMRPFWCHIFLSQLLRLQAWPHQARIAEAARRRSADFSFVKLLCCCHQKHFFISAALTLWAAFQFQQTAKNPQRKARSVWIGFSFVVLKCVQSAGHVHRCALCVSVDLFYEHTHRQKKVPSQPFTIQCNKWWHQLISTRNAQ